ncbi:hypothetical protein L3Y34_014078 [Caenorhabditis briggsae]|uniref:SH2 domain-containing protein n=2 Tax=Caenorhabditis briggsae TaxID=6238 RepID=A0AAE9IX14_CAEBR|nr:hypothetical protein L3Y34_014078 [Caenorhabditis briggsae]
MADNLSEKLAEVAIVAETRLDDPIYQNIEIRDPVEDDDDDVTPTNSVPYQNCHINFLKCQLLPYLLINGTNEILPMVKIDPIYAQELRSSGVTLAAVYLGSIPVQESMSVMVSEMRSQVVGECIQIVAAKVGLTPERDVNPIVARIIGEVKQENFNVDLNISSKMVKVIRSSRLIQRHPLSFFSFGSQGQRGTDTENMFGYIAKNKNGEDRRCHVMSSKAVQKLLDTLVAAIQVNTEDAKAKEMAENPQAASTSGTSGPSSTDPLRPPKFTCTEYVALGRITLVYENVKNQPWYHGHISRDIAQSLIRQPGDFLVRCSDHTTGKFVLSGMTEHGDHKHLILLDEKNQVRTPEKTFPTITELVRSHMENGQPVRSDGPQNQTALMLENAIPRG